MAAAAGSSFPVPAPAAAQGPEAPSAPAGPVYKSPKVRAQVLELWLAAGVFVNVVYGILSLVHVRLLGDRENLVFASDRELQQLDASDMRLVIGGIALLVVFLITAVFFIAWFHRTYKNLPALGWGRLRFGTGWAIGGWFIPIAGWIIPKLIANDVWRASVGPRVPWWVHVWWLFYVASGIAGNASYSTYGDGTDIDGERTSAWIDVYSTPVYVAGTLLALLFVRRVTAAQERRAARDV